MNKTPLTTVCDLKWNYPIFNVSRGEFRSCCRTPPKVITKENLDEHGIDAFLNSPSERSSRLALIKGERHSDCKSCWNLEDSGMKSPRHEPWQFTNHLKKSRIISGNTPHNDDRLLELFSNVNSINDNLVRSNTPYMMEISMGNTCDMKCMYCNHHYSSQWGTELIKWGEITEAKLEEEFPKAPNSFNEKFWEWFNTVGRYSLSRIGIIGGEPLIMPEFYKLLDKLMESVTEVESQRRGKINLWIVSNMNTPPAYLEKFLNYLPKLSKVFDIKMYASMESTEKRAEYIRYGVSWDRFTKNIDTILAASRDQQLNLGFAFMPSVNVLSVSRTKDFVMFVEELSKRFSRPIGISQNIISFPNWQSPLILTHNFADMLDECVSYMRANPASYTYSEKLESWESYANFLETLAGSIRSDQSNKSLQRKKFADWFHTYDYRRNVALVDVFPEYIDFFNFCRAA